MSVCRKFASVFWAAFLLLVVAGQMAHTATEVVCGDDHAAEVQCADAGDHGSCPAEHSGCHAHGHLSLALSDSDSALYVALTADPLPISDEAVLDAPVREIDHPPQLS
ncbi:MAG: hypothetical protein BGO12_05225 [Verrucomicrobia bacterium 61-8]|nr:hypothetical protein [Verrucomicrobiota bacterium]OJV08339.1 MAG: hypothetical protein BGO12_05225 [Verrucomicrobia bacterium 61-8]